MRDEPDRDPAGAPTARELVEERLEPGEPIEAFLQLASRGTAPDSVAGGVLSAASALSLARPAARYAVGGSTIAVTDRRVFFVAEPPSRYVRVEPKQAVRVLSYDVDGEWIRLWLTIDGHQSAYVVGKRLRNAADALVHSLGGAPATP